VVREMGGHLKDGICGCCHHDYCYGCCCRRRAVGRLPRVCYVSWEGGFGAETRRIARDRWKEGATATDAAFEPQKEEELELARSWTVSVSVSVRVSEAAAAVVLENGLARWATGAPSSWSFGTTGVMDTG
jgi:hypothetical protein